MVDFIEWKYLKQLVQYTELIEIKWTLENKPARLLLTYRNTYVTNYWYIVYYGSSHVGTTEAPSFQREWGGKN